VADREQRDFPTRVRARQRKFIIVIGILFLALLASLFVFLSSTQKVPIETDEEVPIVSIEEENTTINSISTSNSSYDKKTVIFSGEIIGDSIYADGEHKWLAINDATDIGTQSISLYVTNEQAAQIRVFGGHGKLGDTVTVRGIFNMDCSEHEGEMDVHVEAIKTVSYGKTLPLEISFVRLGLGAVLVVGGLIIYFIYRRLRERSL
jgi:uncharacterized protein YpmB